MSFYPISRERLYYRPPLEAPNEKWYSTKQFLEIPQQYMTYHKPVIEAVVSIAPIISVFGPVLVVFAGCEHDYVFTIMKMIQRWPNSASLAVLPFKDQKVLLLHWQESRTHLTRGENRMPITQLLVHEWDADIKAITEDALAKIAWPVGKSNSSE